MENNGFDTQLLAGKTVVITGAGRGIGFAIAKAMKECGATIIAHSGRTGTAEALSEVSNSVIEADLSKIDSVEDLVNEYNFKTVHATT